MCESRYVRSTIAALTAGVLAGCAMTGGSLTNSAERLERSAYELEGDARDESRDSGYSRDARAFAEETRDFRRIVEDRRADEEDVEEAFAEVSRRYHALRDEVGDSRDRNADFDFEPVTEAYLDVEREMRRLGERRRDRYARD